MPPPDPPNRHRCVCGWETPYWANMLQHRRACDSWKEHEQASVDRARADAAAYEAAHPGAPERPECPYCEAEFGNHAFLFKHVQDCAERKAREIANAPRALMAAKRIDADLDKLAAFEAWCREHGR